MIADSTLSICTGVVSLDFHNFWSSLRDVVNQTGWTVIEYGTLWRTSDTISARTPSQTPSSVWRLP